MVRLWRTKQDLWLTVIVKKKELNLIKLLQQLLDLNQFRWCTFASYYDFVVHQMDVKNSFINGYLKEEVYIKQLPGFEDPKHPNYVFKLHKRLYELKQAPEAWFEWISSFLVSHGFKRT